MTSAGCEFGAALFTEGVPDYDHQADTQPEVAVQLSHQEQEQH